MTHIHGRVRRGLFHQDRCDGYIKHSLVAADRHVGQWLQAHPLPAIPPRDLSAWGLEQLNKPEPEPLTEWEHTHIVDKPDEIRFRHHMAPIGDLTMDVDKDSHAPPRPLKFGRHHGEMAVDPDDTGEPSVHGIGFESAGKQVSADMPAIGKDCILGYKTEIPHDLGFVDNGTALRTSKSHY